MCYYLFFVWLFFGNRISIQNIPVVVAEAKIIFELRLKIAG